jgi:hypothetical protein
VANQGNEFTLTDLQINTFEGKVIATTRERKVFLDVLNVNQHGCRHERKNKKEAKRRSGTKIEEIPTEAKNHATHQDKPYDQKTEDVFPARKLSLKGGQSFGEGLKKSDWGRVHERSGELTEAGIITDQG